MNTPNERRRDRAVAALLFFWAAACFAQYGFDGNLFRDDAISIYCGARFVDGELPYVSTFDIKGPLPCAFAGAWIGLGNLFGITDPILAARIGGWLAASLAAALMYRVAIPLFRSRSAAALTALLYVAFWALGVVAVSGPRAKTWALPLHAAFLALGMRRSWLGCGASAATLGLVWQPLASLGLISLLMPFLDPQEKTPWRATTRIVAGAMVPIGIVLAVYAYQGHLFELFQSYLLLHLERGPRTPDAFLPHVQHITETVVMSFPWLGAPALLGLVCFPLLAVARRRLWEWRFVSATLVPPVLWTLLDYQNAPDFFVFVPYCAIAFGAAASEVHRRMRDRAWPGLRVAPLLALSATVVLDVAVYRYPHAHPALDRAGLVGQRRTAESIARMAEGGDLLVVNDPTWLILLERTRPGRFLPMSWGSFDFVDRVHPGGRDAWIRELFQAMPDVLVAPLGIRWYGARIRREIESGYRHCQNRWTTVYLRDDVTADPDGAWFCTRRAAPHST